MSFQTSTPSSTPSSFAFSTPQTGFGTPHNGNAIPFSWGDQASSPAPVATTSSPSCSNEAAKASFRYRNYRPANSSPLARLPSDFADVDDMDDDDDDDLRSGGHEPSSPLNRVSMFNIGSSGTRDENESPLFQRRRAQYKSIGLGSQGGRRTSGLAASSPASRTFSGPPIAALFASGATPEDPQRAFLRERFKQRCFERAAKAREKAVKAKRKGEGFFDVEGVQTKSKNRRSKRRMSADGDIGMEGDREDDSESDDEEIMNDELFKRIMQNVNRKIQHSYRVSYQNEVGSSFDPDMEDVARWEEELKAPISTQPNSQPTTSSSSTAIPPSSSTTHTEEDFPEDEIPDLSEWEDQELEAYAEEYARVMEEEAYQQQQAQSHQQPKTPYNPDDLLAGLEGVPEEELFGTWNWESDGEGAGGDVEMDI
ncbi:hypothetical protein CC2G_003770 [Coprinopsis cinerea AmutBmut pab1-1]|nr:hypothetical protein CC2G_003770 [Coprinopsis cinerea AmutBmut pab1-1]